MGLSLKIHSSIQLLLLSCHFQPSGNATYILILWLELETPFSALIMWCPSPHPGPLWSSAVLLWRGRTHRTWEHPFLGTRCLQVTLGVLVPEEPEAVTVLGRQVTWDQTSVSRKSLSESHLLYLALHSPVFLLVQVCLEPFRSSSLLSVFVTSSGFAEFSGIRLF